MSKHHWYLPLIHLIIPLFWFITSIFESGDVFIPSISVAYLTLFGAAIAVTPTYTYLLTTYFRKKKITSLYWWIFAVASVLPPITIFFIMTVPPSYNMIV